MLLLWPPIIHDSPNSPQTFPATFLLYCTRLLKIKSCALFYVDRLFQEFIYLECAVIGNINLDKAAYCTPFPCDAKNNIIFKRVLNLLGGYRHR